MHLLRMRGRWGPLTARLYSAVVAGGLEPLYQRFAAEVVPSIANGAIVDVGCGAGELARAIARRHPGCQVTGIDLSPAMVARARRRSSGLDNVSFREGDATALPFADGSVDVIVSVASIKHWPDRQRGVDELKRVLVAGGTLCMLEADRGCSSAAARRFVGYWRYVAPGMRPLLALYFRRVVAGQALDLDELSRMVQSSGFTAIERLPLADLPFAVVRASAPVADPVNVAG